MIEHAENERYERYINTDRLWMETAHSLASSTSVASVGTEWAIMHMESRR